MPLANRKIFWAPVMYAKLLFKRVYIKKSHGVRTSGSETIHTYVEIDLQLSTPSFWRRNGCPLCLIFAVVRNSSYPFESINFFHCVTLFDIHLLANTEEKCYANGGWGDWMFENCKRFCKYCTPGHPGKIIKDHPHYKARYRHLYN